MYTIAISGQKGGTGQGRDARVRLHVELRKPGKLSRLTQRETVLLEQRHCNFKQ